MDNLRQGPENYNLVLGACMQVINNNEQKKLLFSWYASGEKIAIFSNLGRGTVGQKRGSACAI